MKEMNRPYVTAIILAAGSGTRLSSEMTKQRILLSGQSILYRSAAVFSNCDLVNEIIVVCRSDETEWVSNELNTLNKISLVIPGGKSRAESAKIGFASISSKTKFVAIHDAARCLVTDENICKIINKAFEYKAATACTRVTDTIKRSDNDGFICDTISREGLWHAQTPQVFERELYAEALSRLDDDSSITDDNLIIESMGGKIYPVDCGKNNLKITTADDLAYAEYIIERRVQMSELRVGHGYDVHRFAEGRKLVLGGVEIPFERGLLGHSDADVLVHSIMDAILGACGLGDIGKHFPDTDSTYKDISSLNLLSEVARIVKKEGFSIVNIDATLVMQRPKIAPYTFEMVDNISRILKIERGRVNIKATTEEKLGFTGREEGACAYAIATVKK